MATGLICNMSSLPVLKLCSDDISGSFKAWYEEFELSIQLLAIDMGTVEVKQDGVSMHIPKLTDRARLLALLKCIGVEGRETLSAEGYTMSSPDLTYDIAIDILHNHYSRRESLFVRTQKFVTVRQAAGEDYYSYLVRVQKLSRELDFFLR